MTQVDLQSATKMVNHSFEKWGLPQKIKIDNGRPFVNPNNRDVPTLALLWWTGLGIELIQNTPGRPQENGAVEGLQGTLYRWVNPEKYLDQDSFQLAVNEVGRIQREVYKIPAQAYQTRISLFPELNNNPRTYSKEKFDFSKVEQHMAKRAWARKVKSNGEIRFMGEAIYVGYKHAAKQVTLSYDPIESTWLIHDTKGLLIKTSTKDIISQKKILDFIEHL